MVSCAAAPTLSEFKHTLMDALHEHYRFPNTTFLTGPTFCGAFADPDPVTTGRITPIIDEYQTDSDRAWAAAEYQTGRDPPTCSRHRNPSTRCAGDLPHLAAPIALHRNRIP